MINNTFSHTTSLPAGAEAPAGHKNRRAKLAGTLLLAVMLGLGVVYVHSLPLVMEVKTSFRQSEINISAYTYSDVEEYGAILSRGPQHR